MTLSLADPVKRVANALEGAQFAFVFGSFGTPGFGPESDLDVAVSFRRALPPMDLVSLAGRLETAAGRRVDVVDAVEAAIDVASHLISANGWELPRDARHAFEILVTHGVIAGTSLKVLHAAVGFRNIAVDDYAKLDPQVVRGIAADHLGDLEEFANAVLRKTTAGG